MLVWNCFLEDKLKIDVHDSYPSNVDIQKEL